MCVASAVEKERVSDGEYDVSSNFIAVNAAVKCVYSILKTPLHLL